MRVLLLSTEPPFDPDRVSTGNALRAAQLQSALARAGHTVRQVWPAGTNPEAGGLRNADALRGFMDSWRPEAVLVAYWELLGLLPFELEIPVVLDFVAPRPLEELFEYPDRVANSLRRLAVNLRRCDLLLTGNAEQESLLTLWLLEAGFDLRAGSRVRVVPLAAAPDPGTPPDPASSGFRVVGGGVDWPWRVAGAYHDALRDFAATHPGRLELRLFGGSYPQAGTGGDAAGAATQQLAQKLESWADYSACLRASHIGLELGEDNLERRYSQSFRSLDFLRHGLPLVISRHLPLAREVEARGAGWLVDEPAQLPALFERLLAEPGLWASARAKALQLVRDTLDPDQAARPLLDYLAAPDKAPRLPQAAIPPPEPVLSVPPWPQRLKRRWKLARRVALAKAFGSAPGPRRNVVIVSRGDLWPSDHGAAVKILETARGISRNGRDVGLVTSDRRHYWLFREGLMEKRSLPRWLSLLARPEALVKLDHYTREIPESNAFLYLPLSDGSWFWRLLWVASRMRASILQAEFPAYALPCQQVGEILDAATVLVEHNVEYRRLAAQVPELTAEQFDNFKNIEITLCNRSHAVVCVSDNDRQQLAVDGVRPELLRTIPHGINLEAFDAAEGWPARARLNIPAEAPLYIYHGTFAYPPNRDALNVLAREILPRLERAGIQAHVLAVGHKPPSESPHPRIHLLGSVENLAPLLKAADAAVIPLREGGGTRMKIIECFAASLPVFASAKGIEGIPARPGEDAFISDDWDELCAALARALREPAWAAQLGTNGRALAESLDWTRIGQCYTALFNEVGPGV